MKSHLAIFLLFKSGIVSFIIYLFSYFYFNMNTCRNHANDISRSGASRLGGSEKDRWFLKTPKWQHKLVRKYRRGELFFDFINNAANTCSYDLKISRNIEIKCVFHSKAFFHPFNNFHTGCLSALNGKLYLLCNAWNNINWDEKMKKK